MSFVYGGVDTASLAGVTATLKEWPSLGGLSVENASVPGFDGRIYGGVTMEATTFVFDVIIHGETVEQVHDRRDNFVGLIDPSRGPRSMQLETDTGWVWHDVLVTSGIDWGRMTWQRGLGYRLRADVEFQTQRDPAALELVPTEYVGTGSVSFTADTGNTTCYPTIRVTGAVSRTITIGDWSVTIAGQPSGGTLDLNYADMSFYRTSGGVRTHSLVNHMDNFDRPRITPGQSVTATVSPSAQIRVIPNYRRI